MILKAIQKLSKKQDLTETESMQVFKEIMEGKALEEEMEKFLLELKEKGESISEILGAVKVMQEKMVSCKPKVQGLLDIVGTGGDNLNTFNISTTAMFVAAGAGCKIAKHGNKGVSSKSGSSDVLTELGVNINLTPEKVEKIIEEIGIGFLFAPLAHPAMKQVANVRKKLATRTIFNIVGPLTNPANAEYRLTGAYSLDVAKKMANVLKNLKVKKALIVHGFPGMDEISTCGKTQVFELNKGNVKEYSITPEEFGLRKARIEELQGGTPKENAKTILRILKGEKGAKKDIVLFNAGAALYSAEKVSSIKEGIKLAEETIDSGKALQKLEELKRRTNEFS